MKLIDFKEFAKYEDQYVALSKNNDNIFAAGKTIKEVENELKKLKIKDAVIQYIAPLNVSISPVCQ